MNHNKKLLNLYVDDLRDCPEGFCIARTVEEAVKYMENYNIDILSLDHDLGADSKGNLLKTGYDLVKIICEKKLRANKIFIHTDNPVGRENMYHTLIGAIKHDILDSDIEVYKYPIVPNKYSGF